MIIGDFAAVAHRADLMGQMTSGFEICAPLTEEAVRIRSSIFADWHPKRRMTPQKRSFLEFPKSGSVQNLYLETDFGIVDILSSVLGVGEFPRRRESAEEFEIGGRRIALFRSEI